MSRLAPRASVAFTLLLLASGLPLIAPPAEASHATPEAGLPDVFLDASDLAPATFAGTTKLAARGTETRYNATYDVTFTNITLGSGNGTAGTTSGLRLVTPSGFVMPNPRDAVPDGAHSGRWNVTFPSQAFNATGFWTLEAPVGQVITTFLVQPENALSVSFSQTDFAYTDGNVTFVITVSPLASGQTARIAGPGIPTNTQVAGPSGTYVYFGRLPGAGSFTVTANRSLDDDAVPEVTGSGAWRVHASPLTVAPVDASARAGFDAVAKWNLTYPNGTAVFCPWASMNCGNGNPLFLVNYNLTVNTTMGNFYVNDSDTNVTPRVWNDAVGNAAPPAGTVFSFDTSGADLGVFSFRPGATWTPGAYTFTLRANVKGSGGSMAEYQTTWTFFPATPADVNLDVSGTATGAPGPATLQPLYNLSVIESAGGAGPAGSYSLRLTVTGATQNEHPTTTNATPGRSAIDGFGPGNVTLAGALLSRNAALFAYDPSTGVVTLDGVSPTRYGGDVTLAVSWKGQTTTRTLPIVRGAVLAASAPQLLVGDTTQVTFTVRDDFGNLVPDAQVRLWKTPSGDASGCSDLCGATAINGTGAPGAGQNGQYAFTFTPGSLGAYVAHASTRAGSAYATLEVVPFLDGCSWTLSVCDFAIGLNATTSTRADGAAFGVHRNATAGYDEGLDAVEPPAPADPDAVQAYFPLANATLHRSLVGQQPAPAWPFVVRTGAPGQNATLSWSAAEVSAIDRRYDVQLVDGNVTVDMRAQSSYALRTDATGARNFTLHVRQLADLGFGTLFVTPYTTVGGNVSVGGWLLNAGASPAENATVDLWVDGTHAASAVVTASLAGGASQFFSFPGLRATTPGDHTVRVVAGTPTLERTLANNTAERPFFVAEFGVDVQAAGALAGRALNGTTVAYAATVTNLGNDFDWFSLAASGVPAGWNATLSTSGVGLGAGATTNVTLTVRAPQDALWPAQVASIDLVATSASDPARSDRVTATTTLVARHALALASGWSMVSVPVALDDANVSAVFNGSVDAVYGWDGVAYAEATTLQPGRGYWVLSPQAQTVALVGVPVRNVTLALAPGWNLVGSALAATDLSGAPSNVARTAWTWGPTGYVESSALSAGRGYWLHVDGAATSFDAGLGLAVPRGANAASFLVPVTVTQPGGARDAAAFGVAPGATRGYDAALDALEAPRAAAPGTAQAWMQEAAAQNAGRFHRSVVPRADAMAWTLHVETDASEDGLATLRWTRDDVAGIPAAYRVLLVDGATRVDMRALDAYAFPVHAGRDARELSVVVQKDEGACLFELDGACLARAPVDPLMALPLA